MSTYRIDGIQTVDERPDHGEILEPLGRGGVRNVEDDAQIVSHGAHAALERAGQACVRQAELKGEAMAVRRQHGDRTVLLVLCIITTCS